MKVRRGIGKRAKFLVVFDCDGVLTENHSSWVMLHEHFGSRDNAYFAKLYERGLISYLDWMKIDVALMIHAKGRPIKKGEVEEALRLVKVRDSAREVIRELTEGGVDIAVVSSGVDILVRRVCDELGIGECYYNELIYEGDELIPGGIARVPLGEKWVVIKEVAEGKGYGLDDVVYVGDSKWDIEVFKRVGVPVAVEPCGEACAHAKYVIKDLVELKSIVLG